MTVLPLKLLRVMPVKVDIAPHAGEEERKLWIVVCDGNVSDTSIRNDEEDDDVDDVSSLVPSHCS